MADARLKACGLAGLVVALDRLTKWLIEARVGVMESYTVIPGFFDIVHSKNRGVAFSLFHDSTSPWRTTLLILVQTAALLLIGGMLWNTARRERWMLVSLGLILGGAIGNLIDRVVWGEVTDFLDFYIGHLHWPAFNVADSAVVIGSAILILHLLKPKREAAQT